jgi:hypothetical protein
MGKEKERKSLLSTDNQKPFADETARAGLAKKFGILKRGFEEEPDLKTTKEVNLPEVFYSPY